MANARKLDLSSYEYSLEGETESPAVTIEVRKVVRDVLFARQLNGMELLTAGKLVDKVLAHKADAMLLGDEDYAELAKAFKTVNGLRPAARIVVDRVLNAPSVPVTEAL